MTALVSNFPTLSLFRGWAASETNACRAAASKLPRKSELILSTPTEDMSQNYPMASHSDQALAKLKTFFDHYKPNYQDKEWAAKKKAEVNAEVERRNLEDREGAR